MPSFQLKFGSINVHADRLAFLDATFRKRIADAFATASTPPRAGADAAISLEPQPGFVDLSDSHNDVGKPVDETTLNNKLLDLLGQQRTDGQRVSSLGVIYTSTHSTRRYFGLMFDQFDTYPPQREGGAVFLDEIHGLRGGVDVKQIFFTTIHELGHVFNLHHDNANASFMRRSHARGTHPDRFFRFTGTQKAHLQRCDSNEVYPGGSPWSG